MFYKSFSESKDIRSKTVKSNILKSFLIKGISIIVSVLTVPITLGYVSSEIYGIWLTISSVLIWLSFFDVGFTLGLKNKLAEAISENDFVKGKALVSTTYTMVICIFIPLFLILLIVIPNVSWASFFNVNHRFEIEIQKSLLILSLFFSLQMIFSVITSVVSAFQKVALSSLFSVIGQILSLFLILIIKAYLPPSLIYLSLAYSGSIVLVLVIASIMLFSFKYKIVAPSIKYFDKSYIPNLLNLGVKFFFIQVQIIVMYQSTNVLISHLGEPTNVTEYNIAYKYLNVAMMLFGIVMAPLWPAFTDAFTKKDFTWMNKTYNKLLKIFYFATFCVIIMTLSSAHIYKLWVGDGIAIHWTLTALIALYVIVYMWGALQVNLINGTGLIKFQSYLTFIGLILHIPLSLILGNYIGYYSVIVSLITINIIYSVFMTYQIRLIINNKQTGIWAK